MARNNFNFNRTRPNRTRILNRKVPNTVKNLVRVGPSLFARTLTNIPDRIPDHTANPRVTRIVRLYGSLVTATPTVSVSYGTLGSQDSTDYGVGAFRYQYMRVSMCKVWLEIPNGLSVAILPPTLQVTDSTGYRVSDRGLAGSRYARAGMEFSWSTQQTIAAANSAAVIFVVSTDITIPSSTIIPVTIDVVCEFL